MNQNILQDMFYWHGKQGETDINSIGCELSEWDSKKIASEHPYGSVILNTCAVTAKAQKASEGIAKRLRMFYEDKPLIITGCGVDYSKIAYEKLKNVILLENKNKIKTQSSPSRCFYSAGLNYVKIQEGCAKCCAYCIVGKLRGKPSSRSVADIISEISKIALENSEAKIELIGTQILQYNDKGVFIDNLCRKILSSFSKITLSLNALDPSDSKIYDVIDLIKSEPRMRKELYLSVQSGSDKILMKMRRHYSAKTILDILKYSGNSISFSADMITGFPGETDEDFQESLSLAKKLNLSKIMVCPFSSRKETEAFNMADDVPDSVKLSRAMALEKCCKSREFHPPEKADLSSAKIIDLDGEDTISVIELCKKYDSLKSDSLIVRVLKPAKDASQDEFELNLKFMSIKFGIPLIVKISEPFSSKEAEWKYLRYMNSMKEVYGENETASV